MDGHEPKFTIVKGLATQLILELYDERNVAENLTLADNVNFFMAERPGDAPSFTKAGEAVQNTLVVNVTQDESEEMDVGMYLATFELSFPGEDDAPVFYGTERLYVEVVERVGVAVVP